jgi:hypothetical protein
MKTQHGTLIIEASLLRVPTNPNFPFFATVRMKKNTNITLDGRIYKSESAMRKHRDGRPSSAQCIKITARLESQSGGRYYTAEIVEA